MNVNLNIYIDNVEIDNVCKIKFLYIIIKENLSWKYHITLVKNNNIRNIGVIRKIKNDISRNTMQLLN